MFNPFRSMLANIAQKSPVHIAKDPVGFRYLSAWRYYISLVKVDGGVDVAAGAHGQRRESFVIQFRDGWIEIRRPAGEYRWDQWRILEEGGVVRVHGTQEFAFWSGGRRVLSFLGIEVHESLAAEEERAYLAWKAKDTASKSAEASTAPN